MRSTRPFYSIPILLLFTLLTTTVVVRAQDAAIEGEDYDVKARVMRVSLLVGEVKLKRHDSPDWERARLNLPVVEGDTISTGADARLEIQIDATNFLRVSPNSILRIVTLRDEGVATVSLKEVFRSGLRSLMRIKSSSNSTRRKQLWRPRRRVSTELMWTSRAMCG